MGSNAFGADKDTMREYFSDPVARKGFVNVMRSIGKYGVKYMEISLDSAVPAKHDSFRGITGAWNRTIQGIISGK